MVANPFYCLTLSLLVLPPLLITTYLLAAFPNPPEPIVVHPSLASLAPDSRSWSIYPEDYYPGGAYVSLPFGRVRPISLPLQSDASIVFFADALLAAGTREGPKGMSYRIGGLFFLRIG